MIAIVPNCAKSNKLKLTLLLVSIGLTLGLFSPDTQAQVVVFCNSCQDCSTKSSTPNTVLKLSQDLTQTFGGDCITMNSSNVVLDCNGKTLTGKNLGAGVTNDGHDSVAITHCTMRFTLLITAGMPEGCPRNLNMLRRERLQVKTESV